MRTKCQLSRNLFFSSNPLFYILLYVFFYNKGVRRGESVVNTGDELRKNTDKKHKSEN